MPCCYLNLLYPVSIIWWSQDHSHLLLRQWVEVKKSFSTALEKKKNPQHPINFSSTIFCLWSASSFTTPLTTLIAAWMSGSVDYDLEIPFLMSAFGKLTSVSFPILLFIGCSLKVSASLRNERSFMSLGRRDFNIGRNSWEVLASLIYRFFFLSTRLFSVVFSLLYQQELMKTVFIESNLFSLVLNFSPHLQNSNILFPVELNWIQAV